MKMLIRLRPTSTRFADIRLVAILFPILIQLTWLASALPATELAQSQSAAAASPNVIYIMADELGYYELGCYGNQQIQTPRIDQMAAQGIRFTQAMAGASVCAPTRCCLLTGKHTGHSSVRVNGGGTPLRADEITVASILKRRGYATGGFGKWGCGGRGSTGVPELHGFDIFFGYYDQVHAHSYYPPYLIRNSQEVPLANNHGGSSGETYSHYQIYDAAIQFIRDHQEGPFFCYMPITPPHGIFDIPDSDPAWQLYKDKPWPEQAKRYAAMVSMVDRQTGQLLDLLQQLGLEDNTLVLFSGDNGGNDYFATQEHRRGFFGANQNPVTKVEFRGRKGQLYEGGLRIPMIARWPKRIAAGQVSDQLWYFPDFMPTVAELCNAQVPKDIDGLSMLPTLLGADAVGHPQQQHEYLYWENGVQTAVRWGDWKALQARGGPWQLYDLKTDISEAHDVSKDHSDVIARIDQFATDAHTPAVEGTFSDTRLHERDRRAKAGNHDADPAQARALPREGLLPSKDWKLVTISSQTEARPAKHAFDGDASTHWHTRFSPVLDEHPHTLVIDLGSRCKVSGLRYLARQDSAWNGAIDGYEIAVSESPQKFDSPVAKGHFKKSKEPQEVSFDPVVGRYVRIIATSEINGQAWASASEIGIVGQPAADASDKKANAD